MKTWNEETSDSALLQEYVGKGSEDAFAEIVRRRLPLVYSSSLRRLGDPTAAEDLAQAVFIELARKSKSLANHPAIAGWLYTTAIHMTSDHARRQSSRLKREHNTMRPDSDTPSANPDWAQLQPVIDESMQELEMDDRHAVILRYFGQRDFGEIGRELNLSADAARMRVNRAVEKLRLNLTKRGIVSTTIALESILAGQPAVSIPAGLATTIGESVRQLSPPLKAASSTAGSIWKFAAAALLLLGIGTFVVLLRQQNGTFQGISTASGEQSPSTNRPNTRQLLFRAKPTTASSTPLENDEGIKALRSALFDTHLNLAERFGLLEHCAGLLIGREADAIPIFHEAFQSKDWNVLSMAIEGIGHFGLELLRGEFDAELMALLETPEAKSVVLLSDGTEADYSQSMLIVNRINFSGSSGENPIPELIDLLRRRPDLRKEIKYLLDSAIASRPAELAENRSRVESLLGASDPETRDLAKKVLNHAPRPRVAPTPEAAEQLMTLLDSPDTETRRNGLMSKTLMHASMTPEIRAGLIRMMEKDPAPHLRVEARMSLMQASPEDPALPSYSADPGNGFTDRLRRNEVPAQELVTALADRPSDTVAICQRLREVDPSWWSNHPSENMSVKMSVSALHQVRDADVFEEVSRTHETLNPFLPRSFYRLDELSPLFTAMETSLTPSQYGIAARDLKTSMDSFWKARQFVQPEPSHLPAEVVQNLLVGPYHQNKRAYDAMVSALKLIDPRFKPNDP